MRVLLLALLTLAACTTDDALSPIEGTWSVTLSPAPHVDGCVARGILTPDMITSVFTVVETPDGPLVNAGQTEPGVVEFYVFTELSSGAYQLDVTSYYDDVMQGSVTLRTSGQTVTGRGQVQVYDPPCLQDYTASGRISQESST